MGKAHYYNSIYVGMQRVQSDVSKVKLFDLFLILYIAYRMLDVRPLISLRSQREEQAVSCTDGLGLVCLMVVCPLLGDLR